MKTKRNYPETNMPQNLNKGLWLCSKIFEAQLQKGLLRWSTSYLVLSGNEKLKMGERKPPPQHNMSSFFDTPIEDGSYYVVFVRLPVRPLTSCVRSVTRYRSIYFHETWYKYKSSSDMCRKQEPTLHLHFLWNYGPLKFFLWKNRVRSITDTVQNVFMKLCRNINHFQTMCREKEP